MSGSMAFLLWTKGPMFDIALAIFAIGLFARFAEIFLLGRKPNYAEPRAGEWGPGFRTMLTRTIADPGTFQRASFNVVVGWVWHLGFLIALLLFVPHVELIKGLFGIVWPALPNPVVDLITAITLIALVATLVHRLTHPVKQRISTIEDYLVWTVVFLVVLTGYLAYHRLVNPYPVALGMHILMAEIFLIILPFTKLTHIFTTFIARWYNGAAFGRKGVQS
jgi:nitrate reductase gamma subunit